MKKNQPFFNHDIPQDQDDVLCEYLQSHPEFFIKNAARLDHIKIADPDRGTVSLVEWHLSRLRARLSQVEEQLSELMELGAENHQLFERLCVLQRTLIEAPNCEVLFNLLKNWAKNLGLEGAYVRLFSDKWPPALIPKVKNCLLAQKDFERIRARHFGTSQHYLGKLDTEERRLLLPKGVKTGSVSLSLIGVNGDKGVLIFNSLDDQHYQPGMGVLMLHYLSLIMSELLSLHASES